MCIRDRPYTVKKRINDVVYQIQQEGQQKFKVVYLDRLAKYYFRDRLPNYKYKEGEVLRNAEKVLRNTERSKSFSNIPVVMCVCVT